MTPQFSWKLNILSKEVGLGLDFNTPLVFRMNTLLHFIFYYYENWFWKKENLIYFATIL